MSNSSIKTEMKGTTSRWMRRAEAKELSRVQRRVNDTSAVLEGIEEVDETSDELTNYWVSFWVNQENAKAFEYHGPWWVSGEDGLGRVSICAAVCANSEIEARGVIDKAFDAGYHLDEWRFVNERAEEWSPFSDRFKQAEWMKWPYPVE